MIGLAHVKYEQFLLILERTYRGNICVFVGFLTVLFALLVLYEPLKLDYELLLIDYRFVGQHDQYKFVRFGPYVNI